MQTKMGDETKIQVFDIMLSRDEALGEKGIDDVICKVRPDWPRHKIVKKSMSGGLVNVMLRFSLEDDTDLSDAIVLRVYGKAFHDDIFSRENEILVMQMAHHAGCFPAVLAVFENGTVYEYAQGRPLDGIDFFNPKIASALMRTLAKFKSLDIKRCELIDRKGESTRFPGQVLHADKLREGISRIPDSLKDPEYNTRFQNLQLSHDRLLAEVDFLEKHLLDVDFPQGICHYDLHIKNMVYDDKTDVVCFLDFELTCMGYECFDLAGLLADQPLRKLVPLENYYDDKEPDIDDEIMRQYIESYMKFRAIEKGWTAPTTRDVDLALVEHKIGISLWHFQWIVVLGQCCDSTSENEDMTMISVVEMSVREYFEHRPKLEELFATYKQLKQNVK